MGIPHCSPFLVSQMRLLLTRCVATIQGFHRRHRGLIAAVAYAVFRLNRKAIPLSIIADILQVPLSSARFYLFRLLRIKSLRISLPPPSHIEHSLVIARLCRQVADECPFDACVSSLSNIRSTAEAMVDLVSASGCLTGRNNIPSIAACVYVACRVHLDDKRIPTWVSRCRSQLQFSQTLFCRRVFGGSLETFRKRCREIYVVHCRQAHALRAPWADLVSTTNVVTHIPLILDLFKFNHPCVEHGDTRVSMDASLPREQSEDRPAECQRDCQTSSNNVHVENAGNVADLCLRYVPSREAIDLAMARRRELLAKVKRVIDIHEKNLLGSVTDSEMDTLASTTLTAVQHRMLAAVLEGVSDEHIVAGRFFTPLAAGNEGKNPCQKCQRSDDPMQSCEHEEEIGDSDLIGDLVETHVRDDGESA